MQTTTANTAAQAQAAQAKTSHLVEVYFPTTGKRATFRWPTRRQASRCAKDFAPLPGQTAATAPQVTITPVLGRMTNAGWVRVDAPAMVQGGAA